MSENGILERARKRLEEAMEASKGRAHRYDLDRQNSERSYKLWQESNALVEECELECRMLEQAMSPKRNTLENIEEATRPCITLSHKSPTTVTCNGVMQSQEFMDQLVEKISHGLKSAKEVREEHKL